MRRDDPGPDDDPLVQVRNLEKHYRLTEGLLRREVGRVRAVDGISFEIDRGETLGLVGESGCGKSTAAAAALGLEEPTGGEVRFDGEDVAAYDARERKRFRRRAQLIFQNPDESFDPRMSVGQSVGEPLRIHGIRDRDRRREIVADLVERVGLSADDIDRYPHEFSGGQKQRLAIARALSVNPDLLVADEPASALDVSVQAQLLDLLESLQADLDLSILLISHDLGVVRDVCDRVAVMYLGEIVERGPVEAVFEDPQHPYTRALLDAIPDPDPRRRGRTVTLSGSVPSPEDPPAGCRFHTRCPEVIRPEGYDLERDVWRSIVDLRVRLRRGRFDLESVRERCAITYDLASPADATADQLRETVRAAYDLPASLSDADAERVLEGALEALVAGNVTDARETLAAEFETVCVRSHPDLGPTEAGHPAACHLHDEERRERAGRDLSGG